VRQPPTKKHSKLPRVVAGSAFAFFIATIALVSVPLAQGNLEGVAKIVSIATIALMACLAIFGIVLLSNATFIESVDSEDTGPEGANVVLTLLPTMPIYVSRLASLFIWRRGGRVYVWVADFSRSFLQLRVTTAQPSSAGPFLRRGVGRVNVYVSPEVHVPELRIRLSVLPRPHVIAYWRGGFTAAA
jgi:hypothetical protein